VVVCPLAVGTSPSILLGVHLTFGSLCFIKSKSAIMKQLFSRFPFWSRIFLALGLGAAALVLSGSIYSLLPVKPYFPFVAEVLLLLITWLLLRTDRQKISSLGLDPSFRNIAYLFWGLGIGTLTFLTATWLRTLYTGEDWHLSSYVNTGSILRSLYYILPTVMVQELMFRGYLFTKTISRYGVVWTNVIFAIAFTLVHVIDYDVLQSLPRIVMLALIIPVGHLWFAAALLRSRTLLFPIGLHWGNNWAVQHLVGNTDNQQSILYLTDQKVFNTWLPFIIVLIIFNTFFLLVTWMIWKGKLSFGAKKAAVG
jgi:membrane protease YdiL (CAAX protease family)